VDLTVEVLQERFAISRLPADAQIDLGVPEGFFSITRSDRELSIICAEQFAPAAGELSLGWRCMRVGSLHSLDTPGVLLAAATPISEAGISVFAIASFETDHLLVRQEHLAQTEALLEAAGHSVV
jgi:uncharacterized protein